MNTDLIVTVHLILSTLPNKLNGRVSRNFYEMFLVLKLFPKIFLNREDTERKHGVFKMTSTGKGISEMLRSGHTLQPSVRFSGLFSVYFLFLSKNCQCCKTETQPGELTQEGLVLITTIIRRNCLPRNEREGQNRLLEWPDGA